MTRQIKLCTTLIGMSRLALLALACSSILAAQEPAATEPDPASLTLDALIEQLPPVGEEWIREERPWALVPVAAEFRARIERGVELSDDQWQRALTRTGVLRWRERWPAAEPFALSMRAPGWLKLTRIELDPELPGLSSAGVGLLRPSTCGSYSLAVAEDARYQELGLLPRNAQTLDFTLTLERRPRGVFHTGRLRLAATRVPSIEAAVPSSSFPELDAAMHESTWLRFDSNSDGRTGHIVVSPDTKRHPVLAGVGLSLRVELLEAGEVRESVRIPPESFDASRDLPGRRCPHGFYPLQELPLASEQDPGSHGAWTVRISGTDEDILQLWSARTRWSGTLELGLEELLARGRELNPENQRVWSLR